MRKTTLPAAATVAGIKTLTTAIAGLGLVTGMLIGLPWTGSAQGVARHDVSMRWEVAFSDIGGSSNPNVVDVFLTRGAPFGRGRVVTETPREQSSEPIRTPEFVIKTRRGRVRGRLRVEKTYLETTATHQLAKFEGTGGFDGGTRRYGNATGKVTRVWGKVDCFADGTCDGHLRLTGWVRY